MLRAFFQDAKSLLRAVLDGRIKPSQTKFFSDF